ncbi:MAG: NAD-dependent epimerase/dehydratase family protein [Dongiaceae bacterium]
MSRVLVTGATGFIGPALVEELRKAGFTVRVALRRDAALLPGVEYTIAGAVGPATDWRPALVGVAAVVHLAARAQARSGASAAALAALREVNSLGTRRLAEAAAAAGVRRFVFLSSVKAMGEASPPGRPFVESDPARPADAYGRSKLEGETALREVAAATGMAAAVLRAPLVYGPGVKGNFLRLLRAVERGLPLPVGALRNRRSLIYLGNLTSALGLALRHPAAAGETFLVSDGEDVSTAELVRRLARALGRPARLLPVPPAVLRLADRLSGRRRLLAPLVDDLAVDSGRIRERLGWAPPFGLDDGLAATVAWHRRSAGR